MAIGYVKSLINMIFSVLCRSGTERDGRVIQMSHAISVLKDRNGIPLFLQTPVLEAELGRTWGVPLLLQ